MKKFLIALSAVAVMGTATLVPTAPAMARDHYERGDYYRGGDYDRGDRYYRGDRHYRGDRYDRGDYYRGSDRRSYRSDCGNGAGGTILGAIAGGLLGNAAVGRHGDHTAGVIVGAGVGALAGRAIDRGDDRCR
ncbi:MAG: glycine zipper 2TM domain-containing protein [Alphaproteobacteria bacterium]|nr:glycine zipper 2TM domain-containing protein [Alphaproteobacteria bacterium]